MIKTIDVECNAANPNLPLKPMFAFINSPSSIRVRNVPKRIGDWCIRKVYFTAVYPDSTIKTAECVLTGGVWVGTIEGTNTSGTSKNGYTIFADGTDENGNNVAGYVLGKGDIEILEADGTLSPDPARYTVKLLSAEATQPREGDMYPTDEGYVIWQSGQANLLGTPFEQITSYVDSQVSSKAEISDVEDLSNSLSNYYTKSETSSNVELNTKFDTKADLSSTVDKALISQKLVNNLSDEHSTRVVVDEYDNVLVQKYTTGWYVSKIEVAFGASTDYTETNDYYAYLTDVRLDTQAGRLYYATVVQDKQRNLSPYKWSDFTQNYSTGEFITYSSWTATQAGGQSIKLHLTITNAETPVWVNIARLVPDSAKRSGLLDTQITPYGQFLTPTQVKPYEQLQGYARRAQGSIFMFGRSSPLTPDENHFVTIDYNVGKLCYVGQTQYPWQLSMYDGTTFDPPLQMNYGYWGNVGIKVNGRFRNFAINRDCWLGIITVDSRNTRPCYIMGIENENGSIVADNNFYYYGASYPITFSANNLSIETIDGVEGGITCTRQGTGTHQTELKYFAYEADLSAKADLSAIPTKTSELSNDSGFITSADVPTKTSDLTNDSGFITSADIITKRDIMDMRAKGVPQNTNSQSWFTVKYGTTTENAWYYDEGRWESGMMTRVYATSTSQVFELQRLIESQWTSLGNFSLDNNAEATITHEGVTYSITGYVGEIVTNNQLISQIAALEARIAALEGN